MVITIELKFCITYAGILEIIVDNVLPLVGAVSSHSAPNSQKYKDKLLLYYLTILSAHLSKGGKW